MSQRQERLAQAEYDNDNQGDAPSAASKCTFSNLPVFKYERSHRQILNELAFKRNLLETCQADLDKALVKQSELQQQIENERRISNQLKIDYDQARKKIVQLESELLNANKETAKVTIYLELMEKENQLLKEQMSQLHTEINMKTRKIEKLENELEYAGYDNESLSQMAHLEQYVETLENSMKELELTHKQINKAIEERKDVFATIKSSALLNLERYREKCEEVKKLQQELITLSSYVKPDYEAPEAFSKIINSTISEERQLINDLQNRLLNEHHMNTVLSTIVNNLTQQLEVFLKQEQNTEQELNVSQDKLDSDGRTKREMSTQTEDTNTPTESNNNLDVLVQHLQEINQGNHVVNQDEETVNKSDKHSLSYDD